ncbi:MAG: hypothetical protein Q9162_000531 [Coniocarpon cinnabarinum]
MVIYAPDGEKWACEACLKGHRVTSCSHKGLCDADVMLTGLLTSDQQTDNSSTLTKRVDQFRNANTVAACASRATVMSSACVQNTALTKIIRPSAAARNLTHRRVHSHGSKPVMPNRRSDSLVPRPQLGAHHPPLHRMNNAAHEFGTPYQIKRFTTSTPNVSLMGHPSSEDNLQFASAMQHTTTPPPITTTDEMSVSVPTSTPTGPWIPGHTPSHSRSYQASPVDGLQQQPPTSAGLLQPGNDTSFMNNALSPGNPARYSMNDFSALQWPGFASNGMYSNPTYAASADQLGTSHWSDWSTDTPQYSQGNTAVQTPQNRLSVASVDQPGLTHSPSNTVSEAGSSVHPSDTNFTNFGSQPPATINPSLTSKDYFGLDPVSENTMGDTPNDSFAYPTEGTVNMDDIFGAGPGPAESGTRSESEEMSPMNSQSFATPERYGSEASGPSLVVPQFNTGMGTTSSYIQYPGMTTAGQDQSQQYFDNSMGGAFGWDMSSPLQQQNSMS